MIPAIRHHAGRPFTGLLAVWLCLTLASCAEIIRPLSGQPASWQQHHSRIAAIDNWRLSARMALQTETQGGSLDVFWRQTGNEFDIRMVAPLGKGAVRLNGDAEEVVARFADGSTVHGNPADLLQQNFDVRIPVDALRYWLLGISPDADYRTASWNEQGLLHELRQQGWRVEMRQYKSFGGTLLPTRFYLELEQDDNTNLRFIVRQWQIETG